MEAPVACTMPERTAPKHCEREDVDVGQNLSFTVTIPVIDRFADVRAHVLVIGPGSTQSTSSALSPPVAAFDQLQDRGTLVLSMAHPTKLTFFFASVFAKRPARAVRCGRSISSSWSCRSNSVRRGRCASEAPKYITRQLVAHKGIVEGVGLEKLWVVFVWTRSQAPDALILTSLIRNRGDCCLEFNALEDGRCHFHEPYGDTHSWVVLDDMLTAVRASTLVVV
eukprot:5691873-Amphidinium_carterae.1